MTRLPEGESAHLDLVVRGTCVRGTLVLIGLIGLLSLIVGFTYHRASDNSFHFDDLPNISQNRAILLSTPGFDGLHRAAIESPLKNRKLAYASFAIDWWRGEGSPEAFQQTNVALHIVNSALVLLLILSVVSDRLSIAGKNEVFAAFLASAMWAVHPIQVQSVTYIVQRMAELACMFVILAVLFYISARRARTRLGAAALFILCGMAVAGGAYSKENAWIAPILLVLVEFGIVRRNAPLFRNRWERVTAVTAVTAGMVLFVTTLAGVGPVISRFGPGYAVRDFTMVERVLTQPRIIAFHLSQLVWPLPDRFSLEHDVIVSKGLFDPPSTVFAFGAAILWCFAAVVLTYRAQSRTTGFWMFWLPLTLVIESSFVGLELIFEHRMYLPSIGLFGLAATGALWLMRRWNRVFPIAAGMALILGLSVVSYARVRVWRSPLSLAHDCVRSAPGSSRAWGGLGQALLRGGDIYGAESALQKALDLDPENSLALEFSGVILMDRGLLEEAQLQLQRALAGDPGRSSLLNHLGEVCLAGDDHARAEGYFRAAIAGKPWIPAYHWNRALSLERLDRCEDAFKEWRQFLELGPSSDDRKAVLEHLRTQYESPGGPCNRGQR